MINSEVQGCIGVSSYKDSTCERIDSIIHTNSGGVSFDRCGALYKWSQHSKVDSLRRRRVLIKKLIKASY